MYTAYRGISFVHIMQLSESADKVILDARDLAMQIHLLHLINPEVCMQHGLLTGV